MSPPPSSGWDLVRADLKRREPDLYDLQPGGPLALPLGEDGWLLELTPEGRLICQVGMDMDDIKSLLSDGTPEDLGTDELAKQAKWYLQPEAAKYRARLLAAGFEEQVEMTEQYVAVLFERHLDLGRPDEIVQAIQWCRTQFTA